MVNPMEIMPVLALAFAIACIPILGDSPFKGRPRIPEPRRKPKTRIHLPHPRR
jgi:hypothetical protein